MAVTEPQDFSGNKDETTRFSSKKSEDKKPSRKELISAARGYSRETSRGNEY